MAFIHLTSKTVELIPEIADDKLSPNKQINSLLQGLSSSSQPPDGATDLFVISVTERVLQYVYLPWTATPVCKGYSGPVAP